MKSFEDLGVSPELTEALAAEGIETPTPLQDAAFPVVAKGNNIVLAAGPGSGVFAAWAAGALERIEAGEDALRALVVCATADTADRLAESAARMAAVTGHSVAALGSAWVLPERAGVLFSTADNLFAAIESGAVDTSSVEIFVVDQAQLI